MKSGIPGSASHTDGGSDRLEDNLLRRQRCRFLLQRNEPVCSRWDPTASAGGKELAGRFGHLQDFCVPLPRPLAVNPRGPASDHSADAIAVHHRLEHGAHRVSALRPREFGAARLRLCAELITQHRIVQ
jgi:hypothetical protein